MRLNQVTVPALDIEASIAFYRGIGLRLEARFRDPSQNVICLYWAGESRRFPPWRVQE